jgi:HAD superfamily hydrolase (TIGR01509 family)
MAEKYLIFDFDGVIANTEESNGNFLKKALREYGIILTQEDRQSLIGINDQTELERILKKAPEPVSLEELKQTRARIGNTYENTVIKPMPGLIYMMDELQKNGVKMALATSTTTRLILIALNRMHMISYFDAIVCGDMCDKKKPDPEIYQKVMAYLGAEPENCIVIEDSTVGIAAGKDAGAYVIAYSGSGIAQDRTRADFIVDTYEACQKKIKEQWNFK